VQSAAGVVVTLPLPVGVLMPHVTLPVWTIESATVLRFEPPHPQQVVAAASNSFCVHWRPPTPMVSAPHDHAPLDVHALHVHAFAPTLGEVTKLVCVKPVGHESWLPAAKATGVHPAGTFCKHDVAVPQSGELGIPSKLASVAPPSVTTTSGNTASPPASAHVAPHVK
jgi:hypothetical protein